jgi:hypothetical protein
VIQATLVKLKFGWGDAEFYKAKGFNLEIKVQTSDYGADEIYEGAGAGESCFLMGTQNEWIGKMFCYRHILCRKKKQRRGGRVEAMPSAGTSTRASAGTKKQRRGPKRQVCLPPGLATPL